MAHANPFVIIPDGVTAQTLNEKNPFLLHAIVSSTMLQPPCCAQETFGATVTYLDRASGSQREKPHIEC